MGCGPSANKDKEVEPMPKSEKALKAAMLIQKWYRRYQARLEARRRCTWSIFQSIEYAGEQDQLKLYNFFNDMITHLQVNPDTSKPAIASALTASQRGSENMDEEDADLLAVTDPTHVFLSSHYKGPHLSFPITTNQLETLIEAFKRKQQLHAKYLLQVLHEARTVLKRLPNINQASTSIAKQITICGDLHGKIDDLFIVFYKNGLPAVDNPYVFNGDFVDRGPFSVEIAVILFLCVILNPNEVYLNRGNHEDHVMNLRYGFIKEVMSKYKEHATMIVRLFEDVFSWLPLATVIDNKVLVTHGGISDKTDLEYLAQIDRHKYLSALRPPVLEDDGDDDGDKVDLLEWRQILDVLWSDPKTQMGCKPNTFRGGGSYFGPDITEKILRKHNLILLIRSHECKPEGYEFMHDNQVLTIFSASNYYEIGSNKGAYVKMGPDLKPHLVQYMASKNHRGRRLTSTQRVGMVEESALKSLRERILANKSVLMTEFQNHDPPNIGLIKVGDWADVMANVLQMDLPFRSLRQKLVNCNDAGLVEYYSTFDELSLQHKYDGGGSTVTEAMYRNKASLETIFRIIDKDNSGTISIEEFEEACNILSQHIKTPISKDYMRDIAHSIDINKDGFIDFNEFLEAFRIVDIHGKDTSIPGEDSMPNGGHSDILDQRNYSIHTVESHVK